MRSSGKRARPRVILCVCARETESINYLEINSSMSPVTLIRLSDDPRLWEYLLCFSR